MYQCRCLVRCVPVPAVLVLAGTTRVCVLVVELWSSKFHFSLFPFPGSRNAGRGKSSLCAMQQQPVYSRMLFLCFHTSKPYYGKIPEPSLNVIQSHHARNIAILYSGLGVPAIASRLDFGLISQCLCARYCFELAPCYDVSSVFVFFHL